MPIREQIRGMKNEIGVALAIFRTTKNPFSYCLFRMHLAKSAALLPKFGNASELLLRRGSAEITYMGKNLVFEYNTGALCFVPLALGEIFTYESYKNLKVKGRGVVDVGASIGDTAAYFISKGARKVYCFDTDVYRLAVLKRNLRRNKYLQCAEIFHGQFDRRKLKLKGRTNVLKVDCEGCEYALFDPKGPHLAYIASTFGQIAMEYHNGEAAIRRALESHGYSVNVNRASSTIGILYASKR